VEKRNEFRPLLIEDLSLLPCEEHSLILALQTDVPLI
jgi:hypothetical protein